MRPLVIAGGGIAGLTLGILLRRGGAPVEVWDAAGYPRHRVCGEFISGDGARLLLDLLPELPVRRAETVRFFAGSGGAAEMRLPSPGLTVSRWELDQALARAFEREGGGLIAGKRWTGSFEEEGVVRATGRRLHGGKRGWTGLKAHARGLELTADLEMHFSDAGYVGLSRLPEGVNICALVNERCDLAGFRAGPEAVFQSLVSPSGAGRWQEARLDPASVCAVSGIVFEEARATNVCPVGDAIAMIPPFTGNGMSIAAESAVLAAPPLLAYSRGELSWPEAEEAAGQSCARRFGKRFAAARWMRVAAERSWSRALMLACFRRFPGVLPLCFRLTR